ncbi:hypothetical protein [Vreelandella neptunia]|uniref:hypothetical protein n=1 Tax=Vreelandella neptunia TaxID=115551 RepID=UPI00315A5061
MAMTTPDEINLTLYRIVTGDQREFITKFTSTQTALETFSAQLNPMVSSIAQALEDALTAAEETRQQAVDETTAIKNATDQIKTETAQIQTATQSIYDNEVIPARNATQGYRDEAEAIRDQTQAIAVGDVDITALQPGTLTNPKDYPSTDGAGNLVVRNVDTDVAAHLASGVETITFDAVDKGTISTGTVSFDVQAATKQKLTVGGALTIALTNKPTNDWELEVDLTNGGSAAITFPTVNWLIGDGTTSTVFADMGVTLNAAGANTLLFWGAGAGDVYGRAG